MKWRIGDKDQAGKTSKTFIEDLDYVSALEQIIEDANLYIEPADKEAKRCQEMIDDFIREEEITSRWAE